MRIVSKFKDYYDHIAGLYGIDDKIVYVRNYQSLIKEDYRNGKYHKVFWGNSFLPTDIPKQIDYPELSVFSICNVYFTVVRYGKDYYWGDEALRLEEYLQRHQSKRDFRKAIALHGKTNSLNQLEFPAAKLQKTTDGWVIFTKNPRLSDYNFASILPPNDLFLMLSTFLSQETEVADTRTNVEKILSNGFDKISSFRKM